MDDEGLSQDELHAMEMSQEGGQDLQSQPIIVHNLWEEYGTLPVSFQRGGHGGGDKRLQDKLFRNPDAADPLGHTAGSRDGAMSILIGVAARNSIESGEPVRIASLTDLRPRVKKL
jgi:hypothetical protein